MHHKKFLLTAIIVIVAFAVAISTIGFSKVLPVQSNSPDEAPATQAEDHLEEASGEVTATLPLFHRVDDNYARGSLPMRGGIATLNKLGVKALVDLRSTYDHTDDVKAAAEIAGLAYYWEPMSVWTPPTDDEANRFVSLVTDTTKGPFFVFCADGLNRAGEMTAILPVFRPRLVCSASWNFAISTPRLYQFVPT